MSIRIICLAALLAFNPIASVADAVYFGATNGGGEAQQGRELWKINEDFSVTLASDISPGFRDSNPSDFYQFKGALYFVAERRLDAVNTTGRELFRVDDNGVMELVADIIPGPDSSSPSGFVTFNKRLYFFANGSDAKRYLYYLDDSGVVQQITTPVIFDYAVEPLTSPEEHLAKSQFTATTTNYLYFTAADGEGSTGSPARTFCQLWRLDGNNSVAPIINACADSLAGDTVLLDLHGFNEALLFSTATQGDADFLDQRVFRVDAAGSITEVTSSTLRSRATRRSFNDFKVSQFVEFNGFLYFPAIREDNITGQETAGFARVAPDGPALFIEPLDPGADGFIHTDYVRFNNSLYFMAGPTQVNATLMRITDQSDVRAAVINGVDIDVAPGHTPFAAVVGDHLYVVGSSFETVYRLDAAGNATVVDALRRDGNGVGNYVPTSAPVAFKGALFLGARFAIPNSVAEEISWVSGGGLEIEVLSDIAAGDDLASSPSDLTVLAPARILASVLPSSRSVTIGQSATAFATLINSGGETAQDCTLSLPAGIDAVFTFQTTDAATNQPTGTPNAAVDIPVNGSQSFLFTITPNSAVAPRELNLSFDCENSSPAPTISGVNEFLFSAAGTPVADIIALSATLGAIPGVADMTGTSGSGAFAVATFNVGAADALTVTATPSAGLPVSASVCQTDQTGNCLAPPTPSVTSTIGANGTPTFSVFITATGVPVPLDPAAARVTVSFIDPGGVVRGRTSVAVRTQ